MESCVPGTFFALQLKILSYEQHKIKQPIVVPVVAGAGGRLTFDINF